MTSSANSSAPHGFFKAEDWRIIPSHPDYVACIDGRIASLKRGWRILRGWITQHGYRHYKLDGVRCYGHRLIAEAFIGPPPPGDTVAHHRDHLRACNRADNIEWLSRAENSRRRKPRITN